MVDWHHKGIMCLKEIGLHAPKMLTLIVNIFEGGGEGDQPK